MQPLHPAQETTSPILAFALIFLVSSWVLAGSNGYHVSPNVENFNEKQKLVRAVDDLFSFICAAPASQPSSAHKKFSNVYFKGVDLLANAVRWVGNLFIFHKINYV